jgi:hypothetical protein
MKHTAKIIILVFLIFGCKKEEYTDELGYTGKEKDYEASYEGDYSGICTYTRSSSNYSASREFSVSKTSVKGIMVINPIYNGNQGDDDASTSADLVIEEDGAFFMSDFSVAKNMGATYYYSDGAGNISGNTIEFSYKTAASGLTTSCSCTGTKK